MSFAASLAAHLLLLAALARVVVPPRAARPARIAIELVEVAAAPPPVEAVPAPAPRPAGPGRRRASAPQQPAAPSPSDAARTSSAALADEGIAAGPLDRAPPDLRPRPSVVMPAPGPGVEVATPAPGARGAKAVGGADGLRRSLAELAGRARVENGLAHPYHSDLAKALARSWDVESTVKGGLSGYLAQAGENLKTFGRVWARMAEGYGRTGAPSVVDGGSDRFRELAGLPPGPGRDALEQAEVYRQLRPAWSEGHVATVRVVQGRDGRLQSVELVTPSIDAALDREALAAVPAAVAKVPAPPEVLAGRDARVTLWEFEIEVSITPPIPVVGVQFDEVLGGLDLRVPLDRRIWKRVRLVAID